MGERDGGQSLQRGAQPQHVWPTTNESYWRKKIARNVTRDEENMRLLSYVGWRVFVIWECELKKDVAEENLRRLYENIVMIDEI